MRTSNLTDRAISGINIITQGQTELAQVKKAITQTIVAKKREEVRDDLRGYAEAPNFHLDGNSDDDQDDIFSESESNCSEQWYELDGQEQEALISLRDARKNLQHATKSRRYYPKGGGGARSTGKSIDVVPSVTEKKTAHSLPEAARRDPPLQRAKAKVVGSGERNLMEKNEEVHRTTRLWRSPMMVRKLERHI